MGTELYGLRRGGMAARSSVAVRMMEEKMGVARR